LIDATRYAEPATSNRDRIRCGALMLACLAFTDFAAVGDKLASSWPQSGDSKCAGCEPLRKWRDHYRWRTENKVERSALEDRRKERGGVQEEQE